MTDERKILLRAPFSEQYTLTIDSEVKGVDVFVTSKVQLRYDFHVLKVDSDLAEVRLVQLDNVLLESNNPMVGEVAQVSQIFGRMYNELHILLDRSGDVIEVLNTDLVLSKWQQTKAEMEKHIMANEDLQNAIILNDAIFKDPEKIKIAAQANEFLRIYFGNIFDKELPDRSYIKGTNIFNTAALEWKSTTENSNVLPPDNTSNVLAVTTKSEPKHPLEKAFYQAAYSQFTDKIDIKLLDTQLFQQETRMIDYATGRLQEAEVEKQEVADEKKLYNKLKYTLKSDSGSRSIPRPQQVEVIADAKDDGTFSKSRFTFF